MAKSKEYKEALYDSIMRKVAITVKKSLNESKIFENMNEETGTESLESRLKTSFEEGTLVEKLRSASAELSEAVEDSIEALKLAIEEKDADKKNSYLKNILKYHKIYLKTLNKMATLKK